MGENPVWQGRKALLPFEAGRVFFDGIFTEPQLNHPECLAFDEQGNIWCGGEKGEIFVIDGEGRSIRQVATTGGFALGMAFGPDGKLYVCDLKHAAVFKVNPVSGEVSRFADGDGSGRRIAIPNYPVVDRVRGCLYVSDSHSPAEAGGGVWRFDLETGRGGLWYDAPLRFANGMALSAEGDMLYVAETFARRVSRIPIRKDGSPGVRETVTEVDALPDGLALDAAGRLYISCYEPSLVYRWERETGLELLFYDPEAHTLCHPTNCAVRGNDLYTANLGRWHITRIENGAV